MPYAQQDILVRQVFASSWVVLVVASCVSFVAVVDLGDVACLVVVADLPSSEVFETRPSFLVKHLPRCLDGSLQELQAPQLYEDVRHLAPFVAGLVALGFQHGLLNLWLS